MAKKQINCSTCSFFIFKYDCKKIEESGGFKYWGCLLIYLYGNRTKALARELMREASVFLSEYDFCWMGGLYLCKLPYGKYIWHFAVRMKQQQLWNYREFKEGYKFGLHPKEPYRDANPYQEPSRNDSWDCGYILGLHNRKG